MELSERRKIVLQQLDEWNINYTLYNHPPLPTIEIALSYWKNITATHCKNLFFRNHKGNRHYLVIFECHKNLPIHDLEHLLHQGKLSFASPERMERYLGTTPGSVSLFGLINDHGKQVYLFIDEDVLNAPTVSFHPNDNTASLTISNSDLKLFLSLWGGNWSSLKIQ